MTSKSTGSVLGYSWCPDATPSHADIASARWSEDTAVVNTRRRRVLLVGTAIVAALAIAIPVMGADPSPSGGPPGLTKPDKSPKPNKPDKAAKAAKGPEVAVSVRGTLTKGTDDKGRPTYSVTAGGTTWELSAGPSWYWGDKNPLNAYVGKSVSIAGSTHAGDTELDVETVDGKALRAAGKPPWAGGPWVVGETHPGWKPWMVGGKPGKGFGRENAPGQLKDKTSTD